jgi:hypothetical protein
MSGPLLPVTDLMGFVALLGLGLVLALPFTVVGVTLTLALTRAGLPPGRAYGVDLLGAALGAVLVIPLLDALDAASAVLVAARSRPSGRWAFAAAVRTCPAGTGRKGQLGRRAGAAVGGGGVVERGRPRSRRCGRRGSRGCTRTTRRTLWSAGTRTRG